MSETSKLNENTSETKTREVKNHVKTSSLRRIHYIEFENLASRGITKPSILQPIA